MPCRAFTLLEVVVSLAILIALAALVVPSVQGRIGGESARSVSREIAAGIGLARSDSIRESSARRVVFVAETARQPARLVARPLGEAGAGDQVPRFVGPILDDPPASGGEEGASADVLLLELPRGASLSRIPPAAPAVESAGDPDPALGTPGLGGSAWGDPANTAEITLGVLLPTGGAVPGAPVYVTLAASWTLVVALDPWTGDATVTPWEPPALEDEWPAPEDPADEATTRGSRGSSAGRGNMR